MSRDCLVWDNTSSVVLERTRGKSAMSDYLNGVKRRALRVSELLASQGAYVGGDVRWHIPAAFLTELVQLKPADVVVDEDGERWTAIDVALNKNKQTWALTCRNLRISIGLEDKIDIERPQIIYDAAGAVLRIWPPTGGLAIYRKIRAKVQLLSKEHAEERGLRGYKNAYAVVVEKQLSLETHDRIKWTDSGATRYLRIETQRNPELITELPVLDAVLDV